MFIQTKKSEQATNNNSKLLLNSLKSLIYLLVGETANHVNFMQHTHHAILALEGDIRKVSKILTSGN